MKTAIAKYAFHAVICAAAGIPAAVYGEPNLIENPDFDTSIDAWIQNDNGTTWASNEDYLGTSESGAALIAAPTLFPTLLTQCVTLSKGGVYTAKAWAKSACGNDVELDVVLADDQCNASTSYFATKNTAAGVWGSLEPMIFTVPNGDNVIFVLQNTGACHENVYFDHVSFVIDRIFLDNFGGS